ncbi:uncharacterized protein VP01_10578g1, partial [Puccinia sorghi]
MEFGMVIFADLVKVYVVVYLDAILVYSKNFDDHFYSKLSRCKFHNSSLQFLGDIFASNSISMDPAKCQKVLYWPQPMSVKTLQGFLALNESNALKKAFTTAPILAHFSELARNLIETNASDYAVAGVTSQYSSSNLLHPVAFESQKLHNSELNYKIHDKELLEISFCLQKWCSYLL